MLLKNNTLWVISDTSRLTCYSKTAAKIKSQRWPGPVSTFLVVHHYGGWVVQRIQHTCTAELEQNLPKNSSWYTLY